MNYAGFWRRFGAAIVDGIILWVAIFVLGYVLELIGIPFFTSRTYDAGTADMSAEASFDIQLSPVGSIIGIAAGWLYFALQESSARGATLGKRVIGLRVTDMDGNRISFGRATARHFSKYLSALILLIGYIMAGFTAKKQALHDMIAKTLVVARSA